MIRIVLPVLLFLILTINTGAQTGSPVLIEVFTETGCAFCKRYDPAFQELMKANAEKVVVISYHCYYSLDTFYQYNKSCDKRYIDYNVQGFPSGIINGKKPSTLGTHLSYITGANIDTLYKKEKQFSFEISSKAKKTKDNHSAEIKIKAEALNDISEKNLRMYVAVTENNIDYDNRYHSKTVNGQTRFENVMRGFLPGEDGTPIGEQKKGNVNTVKLSYTNNDKEINFEEVRIVVFIQDTLTKKVYGTMVMKDNPFK